MIQVELITESQYKSFCIVCITIVMNSLTLIPSFFVIFSFSLIFLVMLCSYMFFSDDGMWRDRLIIIQHMVVSKPGPAQIFCGPCA